MEKAANKGVEARELAGVWKAGVGDRGVPATGVLLTDFQGEAASASDLHKPLSHVSTPACISAHRPEVHDCLSVSLIDKLRVGRHRQGRGEKAEACSLGTWTSRTIVMGSNKSTDGGNSFSGDVNSIYNSENGLLH